MKTITTSVVTIEEVPDDAELASIEETQSWFDRHKDFQAVKIVVTNVKVTKGKK